MNSVNLIKKLVGLLMLALLASSTTQAQEDNFVFFSRNQFQIDENAGHVNVDVRRSSNLEQPLFVAVRALEENRPLQIQTYSALAGRDFKAGLIGAQFAANEDLVTIQVEILDNPSVNGTRVFRLEISNPSQASVTSGSTAQVHIRDNERHSFLNPTFSLPFQHTEILAVLSDGKFIAKEGVHLVRLHSDGQTDLSFVSDFAEEVGIETFRFIEKAAVAEDGKVYAAGGQERFNINNPDQINLRTWVERYLPNGQRDESFQFSSGSRLQFLIAMGILSDGNLLLAGHSENFNTGSSSAYLMKVLPDGSVDSEFSTNALFKRDDGILIQNIKPLEDGGIFVWGRFGPDLMERAGQGVLKINEDASLQEGFRSGLSEQSNVLDLVELDDGTLIVCGGLFNRRGEMFRIARLLADGQMDTSFLPIGNELNERVSSLAWDRSQQVLYAMGAFTQYQDHFAPHIIRLDLRTDNLDNTLNLHQFLPFAHSHSDVELLPGGELLIENHLFDFEEMDRNVVEFIETDFDLMEGDPVESVKIRRTGASHSSLTVDLARMETGAVAGVDYGELPDRVHFQPLQTEVSIDVHPLDDGKVDGSKMLSIQLIHAGEPGEIGNLDTAYLTFKDNELPHSVDTEFHLERVIDFQSIVELNEGGFAAVTRDQLIGIGLNGKFQFTKDVGGVSSGNWNVHHMVSQPNGKLLVAGLDFSKPADVLLARIDSATGSVDDSFTPPSFKVVPRNGAEIRSIAIQTLPDGGRIMVGGRFAGVASLSQGALVRLHMDGTPDTSYHAGTGFEQSVSHFPAQVNVVEPLPEPHGIFVGGVFDRFDDHRVNNLVLLKPDGTFDPIFRPDFGLVRHIETMLGEDDGGVLVAGDFVGLQSKLVRLQSDGSLDKEFQPVRADGTIYSICRDPRGGYYVVGGFQRIQGVPKRGMARLHLDGSVDVSFVPGLQMEGGVHHLFPQDDGGLFLSGSFNEFDNVPVGSLFRLRPLESMSDPLIVFGRQAASYRLEEGDPLLPDYIDWEDGFSDEKVMNDRAVVSVTRLGATDQPMSYDVFFESFGASQGLDFEVDSTGLSFDALAHASEFEVRVLDDGMLEPFEWGDLSIQGGEQTALNRARIEIVDDEIPIWLDPSFAPEMPAISSVRDFVTLPDGSIILATMDTASKLWKLTHDGQFDESFQFQLDPSTTIRIETLLLLPDGSLLVGGNATINGRVHQPVLKKVDSETGAMDESFNEPVFSRSREDESITALAFQEIGSEVRILMGGNFRNVHNHAIKGLARLLLDGSLDNSFELQEGIESEQVFMNIRSIIVLPDEKGILVGGSFHEVDGQPISNLVKLSPNGHVDGPVSDEWGTVRHFWSMSDASFTGGMLIAGEFSSLGTKVVRWHPDTGLDASFNVVQLKGSVSDIEQGTDGQIYLSGELFEINGVPKHGLVRLNADGFVDLDFHAGRTMDGNILDISLDSQGRLLMAGTIRRFDEVSTHSMARLLPQSDPLASGFVFFRNQSRGSLSEDLEDSVELELLRLGDRQFPSEAMLISNGGTGTFGEDYDIPNPVVSFEPLQATSTTEVQALDDGILEKPEHASIQVAPFLYPGQSQVSIRIEDNEVPVLNDYDYAKGVSYLDIPGLLATLPNGRMLVSGSVQFDQNKQRRMVAVLNEDGSVYEPFDMLPQTDGWAVTASLLGDDFILGGDFHISGLKGNRNARILRLTDRGQVDGGFATGEGSNGPIYALATDPAGRIYVGGSFLRYDGERRRNIARLNEDGDLDVSWTPAVPNHFVQRIDIQNDGDLIISGGFDRIGSSRRNGFARLKGHDGSLDADFDPQMNGYISDFALLKDGAMVVVGAFSEVDGFSRKHIVRLLSDGSVDPFFYPDLAMNNISFVKSDDEGNLTIAGTKEDSGNREVSAVMRVLADGTVDESFTRVLGHSSNIYDLTFATDGLPILFGDFPDIRHSEESHLLKLTNDDPSQTMIHFANTFYRAFESDGFVELSLDRIGDVSQASEVSIRLLESDSMDDQDFFDTHYIGIFEPLEHQTTVSIPVHDDFLPELDETVSIEITPLTSGDKVGISDAILRVADNDRQGSLDATFRVSVYRPSRYGVGWLSLPGAPGRRDVGRYGWSLGQVEGMHFQKDGRLLIQGEFDRVNEIARSDMARLFSDGQVDESFELNSLVIGVDQFELQSDDRIILLGITGNEDQLVRLLSNGEMDPGFTPLNLQNDLFRDNMSIRGMKVLEDDRILIWGRLHPFDSTGTHHVARLESDGSLDTSFNVGVGPNEELQRWSVAVQPDQSLVVGGRFTRFADKRVPYLVRLTSSGVIGTSFGPDLIPDRPIEGLAGFNDGSILIKGGYAALDDQSTSGGFLFVRPDGQSIMNRHFYRTRVSNAVLQPNGRIVISNSYEPSGSGWPSPRRLLEDGDYDETFDVGLGVAGSVEALKLSQDGDLFLAGSFSAYNGHPIRASILKVRGEGVFAILGISLNTDGTTTVHCSSHPGDQLSLEVSNDLLHWNEIIRRTADGNTIDLKDDSVEHVRFYRVRRN